MSHYSLSSHDSDQSMQQLLLLENDLQAHRTSALGTDNMSFLVLPFGGT